MLFPPGTILQRMYLRRRLTRIRPGRFIEVGTGEGHLSALLLRAGWRGAGIEPDPASAARAREVNRDAIAQGRYEVVNGSWLEPVEGSRLPKDVDLIVSCMVLEHLDDRGERAFFIRCAEHLGRSGRVILLVPACEAAWGIEDELAGHFRRYTRASMRQLLDTIGWRLEHLAGLTYPVSNLLLPLSNRLVRRAEAHKRTLSMQERTSSSGRRRVPGKTAFPAISGLILNEITMYPLHLLQLACRGARAALVLYAEASPSNSAALPCDAVPAAAQR
jgi:SAM-dependent methyltransferase